MDALGLGGEILSLRHAWAVSKVLGWVAGLNEAAKFKVQMLPLPPLCPNHGDVLHC